MRLCYTGFTKRSIESLKLIVKKSLRTYRYYPLAKRRASFNITRADDSACETMNIFRGINTMNPKLKSIVEAMEKASLSRMSFAEAEQQIRRITADCETQGIKTNALQILSRAKGEVEKAASDQAGERLKVFRRAALPVSDFVRAHRAGGQ
jgi:hypothetical protein